jgi:hypothetical protein
MLAFAWPAGFPWPNAPRQDSFDAILEALGT